MTIDKAEGFAIGRVINRTIGVLMRNAGMFLALAAILSLPNLLLSLYVMRNSAFLKAGQDPALAAGQLGQNFAMLMVTGLIGVVFLFVLQAALVQGAISDLNGEKPSLGNCLSTGFKSFVPLIAISLLAYLGMILGLILLVVPGVILLLMWFVVVPVFVVERPGILQSFGRSRAMTKGDRWKILGLLLLYFVVVMLVAMVVALLFGVSMLRPGAANTGIGYLFASWLVNIPQTALLAVGVAAIYYELRLVKEGVGPQQLAAAFD